MSDLGTVAESVCVERMKRLEDRVDKIETVTNDLHSLTLSVERLTITVRNMGTEQASQKERIEAIENRDGEMWRELVKQILIAVVGIIVGYAARNFGL